MKRVSIFIREDQFERISNLAKEKGISSAGFIREAIDFKLLTDFGKDSKKSILQKTFGILSDRIKKNIKSEDIKAAIRSEWSGRTGGDKK